MLKLVVILAFLCHTCLSYDWDYFTFSQQWPPGTCAEAVRETASLSCEGAVSASCSLENVTQKHDCVCRNTLPGNAANSTTWPNQSTHHKCLIPKEVQTWTNHGLWPSIFGTREPHDCNSSWHFDLNQVATIRADLDTYWPNLFDDTSVDSFWAHEWSKHGTCCTDLEATKNELQYFTKGIALNRQFDISKILADSGVVPSLSATYSFDDFMAAINKSTGYNPVLQCQTRKMKNGSKLHMIGQVEICLTKEFKVRTCYSKEANLDKSTSYRNKDSSTLYFERRHRAGPQSDCPRHYNFYYPPMHYEGPAFG